MSSTLESRPEQPVEDDTLLIPARMLNEWTYCPRLGVLEWVHGEWNDNVYTVDGTWKHRRVDQPGADLAPPGQNLEMRTRSLWLSSEAEGLTARLDLVEMEGDEVVVVDTKRGALPLVDERAWEPERVQLCAQGLVLKDHGYECERGYLFYVESHRRVEVLFDEALIARTRELTASFREAARSGELPAPLDDSPKCVGCSLVEICLPDEVNLLKYGGERVAQRQLLVPVNDSQPLYVTTQGSKISRQKGEFIIKFESDVLAKARVMETSQINIYGYSSMTSPALCEAMSQGIPVNFFSSGGWFSGCALGHPHKNIVVRVEQFEIASDPERSLAIAKSIVFSKLRNQRTLLRRNLEEPPLFLLAELRRLAMAAKVVETMPSLLGLEGAAAKLYFQNFGTCFRTDFGFDFKTRNRRPSRDPVNTMLNFGYGMLTRECFNALWSAGMDPYLGFYHQPRYGRPALALDLMEEFRPLIVDSVVLMAVNNKELTERDFSVRASGCTFSANGKQAFIKGFERRLSQEITHPIFDYKMSWRRVIEVQARLLSRHLLGELPSYTPIEAR